MNRPPLLSRVLLAGTLNRDLKLLCASNFIGAFGDGLFIYTLPIYLRGLEASPANVGMLYLILSLSSALTIILGGFLADRFDRKKIMILGWAIISMGLGKIGDKWSKAKAVATALVISSISLIVFISFSNFHVLVFASFLNGASYPLWSLMDAAVCSIAPEASRGRWISFSQTMTTLTAFIVPYLGGILYEASLYMPFQVVIAATLLLSLVAFTKPLKET